MPLSRRRFGVENRLYARHRPSYVLHNDGMSNRNPLDNLEGSPQLTALSQEQISHDSDLVETTFGDLASKLGELCAQELNTTEVATAIVRHEAVSPIGRETESPNWGARVQIIDAVSGIARDVIRSDLQAVVDTERARAENCYRDFERNLKDRLVSGQSSVSIRDIKESLEESSFVSEDTLQATKVDSFLVEYAYGVTGDSDWLYAVESDTDILPDEFLDRDIPLEKVASIVDSYTDVMTQDARLIAFRKEQDLHGKIEAHLYVNADLRNAVAEKLASFPELPVDLKKKLGLR